MKKNLIYIMNHYSDQSVQHFFHIIKLLEKIADNGVKIALIIEKAESEPIINHKNIIVICQKKKGKLSRPLELVFILIKLWKQGFNKVFIRITFNSALISIIIGRLIGLKSYYWHSGTTHEIDKKQKLVPRIKWFLTSYLKFILILRFVNYFVTGPEKMVEYYSETFKLNKNKIIMLYNDIDINRFKNLNPIEKRNLRIQYGVNKNQTILLMVHRLSPVRKTDFYIPAIISKGFFESQNVKLYIVGEGPEKSILEKSIKKNGLENHVEFLGNIPNHEVQNLYQIADLFINPSYTEGFPRVLIEAMSCGLPIISTDAGGSKDLFGLLQQEFIVNRNHPHIFKDKISELVSNSELMKKLSDENLLCVNRFSTENVSKMYVERIFNDENSTY